MVPDAVSAFVLPFHVFCAAAAAPAFSAAAGIGFRAFAVVSSPPATQTETPPPVLQALIDLLLRSCLSLSFSLSPATSPRTCHGMERRSYALQQSAVCVVCRSAPIRNPSRSRPILSSVLSCEEGNRSSKDTAFAFTPITNPVLAALASRSM